MKQVRLLVLAAMALLAFGVVGAAVANAETAELLLLENGVTKLEAKFTGGANKLGSLAGKELTGTSIEGTLKGCENLGTSEKDTNSCKGVTLTFKGVKQGTVNCRSEAGETKDAIETVLVVTDLKLAAEESTSKTLQPLLLFKVLGQAGGEEELTINCGGVKDKVKGTIGCLLLPGLENIPTTKEAEIACKISSKKDPETGKCEVNCEWLTEHPFESNLGAGFEDSWMEISAKGKFNKDIFLDD
jgi:hypothetical protein